MINLSPTHIAVSFRENYPNKESNNSLAFEKTEKKSRPYNDPLMKWPIRGLAFTNDIGAAVMDIAPKLGTLLWYPAMMYFGADIYDKYRNNKESYDPNARRGLSQAIFQAFASVIFPIVAVHTGQKTASVLARKSDTKLSLQTQEEASKFLQDFMSRRKLYKYKNNKDAFKTEFSTSLENFIDNKTRDRVKSLSLIAIWVLYVVMHPSSGSGTSMTTFAKCLGGHHALFVALLYGYVVHIERLYG